MRRGSGRKGGGCSRGVGLTARRWLMRAALPEPALPEPARSERHGREERASKQDASSQQRSSGGQRPYARPRVDVHDTQHGLANRLGAGHSAAPISFLSITQRAHMVFLLG